MINKFVFLPPQSDLFAEWIPRLLDSAPGWDIAAPETDAEAKLELENADAAFGTMTPDLIACAPNLRWLQAPAAAPDAGYYFDELIAPVLVGTKNGLSGLSTVSFLLSSSE